LRDYKQLTVRLPIKAYEILKKFAEDYGLTLQDAILIVIMDWVREVE
jgi:hypothetical protein